MCDEGFIFGGSNVVARIIVGVILDMSCFHVRGMIKRRPGTKLSCVGNISGNHAVTTIILADMDVRFQCEIVDWFPVKGWINGRWIVCF